MPLHNICNFSGHVFKIKMAASNEVDCSGLSRDVWLVKVCFVVTSFKTEIDTILMDFISKGPKVSVKSVARES